MNSATQHKSPLDQVNDKHRAKLSLFTQTSNDAGIRDTSKQDQQVRKAKTKTVWRLLFALAIITGLAWLSFPLVSFWLSKDTLVSSAQLRFAEVDKGILIRDIAVQGTIVAANSPTLFATNTGNVNFLMEAGDQVNTGDLLAKLQSPTLHSHYAQEQASLASMDTALKRLKLENRRQILLNKQNSDLAKLSLKSAKREFERAQISWQKKLISAQDFTAAEDTYQRAQIQTAHIESESSIGNESLEFDLQVKQQERQRQALRVEELQRQINALKIYSPVTGMVGEWLTQQQARVQENAPLLSVVDLSVLEVDARVAENYGNELRVGMAAELQLLHGRYPAFIHKISPQVEAGQVSVRLRFKGDKPAGLRQSQRLSGRIILQEIPTTLRVERGGFLQADGGNFAYKVDGDRAHKVPIRTGAASINHVEIISGLKEGDKIIISNTEEFSESQNLRLMNL